MQDNVRGTHTHMATDTTRIRRTRGQEIHRAECIQAESDSRPLTQSEKEEIEAFQARLREAATDLDPQDPDWVMEVEEAASFTLLRNAKLPTEGHFDLEKHILGGHGHALCGAATGTQFQASGFVLYCQRCVYAPV